MKKDNWLSDLETGIFELDRDNRALMGLVDRVIAAAESTDSSELRNALIKLQDQAKIDFAREDGLMDALRYQGAAPHQSEHHQLLAEIQSQIDDLATGQAHTPHILRFQKNWFIQHISSQDVLLGQAILDHKGIQDRRDDANQLGITADELDAFEDRRQGILDPVVWTSKLNVGVEAIDAGHRAMVELFNSIIDCTPSNDRTQLAALLEQLGNVTAAHFETEEKLMDQFGYEDTAAHKNEHQKLLQEYGNQVDDWRENHISSVFLCRFMYRWLLRHVVTTDKHLGEAIQRQRVC
jgi:hemerythrin